MNKDDLMRLRSTANALTALDSAGDTLNDCPEFMRCSHKYNGV